VPTDTLGSPTAAGRFVLRAGAWSLGLFGLLRLSWIEAHLVLPFTRAQASFATRLFGAPAAPVEATLACSGTDALALCLGAILAFPAKWRTRLAGAAAGTLLILALNSLRIGTLGMLAASPARFDTFHTYVWPAVLTLAIAGYVIGWMRFADRRAVLVAGEGASREAFPAARPRAWRRFGWLAAALLLVFVAASPLYLESSGLLALGGFMARAAAGTLRLLGVDAHAAGNVLAVPSGSFLVTQECIATPLIPIYLAAVLAWPTTRRWRILGVLAAAPIFTVLGIARLLVVALPGTVMASPVALVHAFYQLLVGALVVFLAALWRHGGHSAPRHAALGGAVGLLFVLLLGPYYTRAVTGLAGMPPDDPQGALALLPAFQIGLYLALWMAAAIAVGWGRFLAGLAALGLTQAAGLLALHALATHAGLAAQVRDVRGWAVAGPVLAFAAAVKLARARR
jgi:exosortase/archaeosortase family protein